MKKRRYNSSRSLRTKGRNNNRYLLREMPLYSQAAGAPLVCHFYPNSYGVGMSNLGFQKTFRLWQGGNGLYHDGYGAERAFMPDGTSFPSRKLPKQVLSFETGRLIKDFAVLSVSVSYELDFLNLIRFLHRAEIPLKARQRDASHPLVIMGGAALTINPLPVAEVADCIVMGEAEGIIPLMREIIISNLDNRGTQLRELRELPGIYFHGKTTETSRLYEKPLTESTHSLFLSPDTSFSDTFLIETGRGCGAHCRFCTAGYLYRPPRHYDEKTLMDTLEEGMQQADKTGLFASDVTGNPALIPLLERIAENRKKVTLSSFRMDKYNHRIIELLAECGTKTLTIAPEAGSETLRKALNKPIGNDTFFEQLEQIYAEKMFHIKLYFLIGLPHETEEDVQEIVDFLEATRFLMLKAGKKAGHLASLSVGINHVIPKTVTPWYNLLPESPEKTERKMAVLAPISAMANVQLKLSSLHESLLQTLLSCGDETLLPLIEEYALSEKWKKVLPLNELHRKVTSLIQEGETQSKLEERFNMGFTFDYLRKEKERGERKVYTIDCLKRAKCSSCGIICEREPSA